MPKHQYDIDNFYAVLKDFPDQFVKGVELSKKLPAMPTPQHTVISGMGGSALPGDILNTYLRGEAHVYMNRDYGVPHWVGQDTLVICVSYSGNTEETIESFFDARKQNAEVCVITSGGELLKLAKQFDVPIIKIPGGLQPRCATGYLFSAMLGMMMKAGVISSQHRDHVLTMANELSDMEFEEEAQAIAQKLKDHVPVLYASDRFHPLARIWKIKINENAKSQAFHNAFPELNHNEMVGYTNLIMKPYLIFMKSSLDHERVQRRMEITGDILTKKQIPVMDIHMRGTSILTQIFSTLLLGDWISYYLAGEYGVDPTPVNLVEEFKDLMKE